MSSDDLIDVEGTVTDVHPGGSFSVTTEHGQVILAHLGGKLRKNHIRVILGDKVTVQVSPYDLTRGRIQFRHK